MVKFCTERVQTSKKRRQKIFSFEENSSKKCHGVTYMWPSSVNSELLLFNYGKLV